MNIPNKNIEKSVSEFTFSVVGLIRRVRAQAQSKNKLSLTQNSVMYRLDKDGPASIADLARLEGVKSQSMSRAIADLEQMGLVERTEHPTDGRQMNIALTIKGKMMRDETWKIKQLWLIQAISQLDKNEQNILFEAGRIINKLVEL